MSAERVADLRRALLQGAPWGPKGLGFEHTVDAFELAIRSDQRARDFPPVPTNNDAEDDAA